MLSRLPQRRLLEHIDLDKVETYWITTQDVTGSIQPSLEQIEDILNIRIENHTGIAVVEGIEWLISLFGFSNVLNMVMNLKIHFTENLGQYYLLFPEDVFSEIEFSKWNRESKWDIPKYDVKDEPLVTIDIEEQPS